MKILRVIITLCLVLAAIAVGQQPIGSPSLTGTVGLTGATGATGATGPAATQSFAPVASTYGSDAVCALHADTITGLTCDNAVVDGTTLTPFTTTASIAAGTLNSTTISSDFALGILATGTTPTVVLTIKYGTTTIYTSAAMSPAAGTNAVIGVLSCRITAGASGSSNTLVTACAAQLPTNFNSRNTTLSNTTLSVTADTTTTKALSMSVTYSANTAGNAAWLYSISPGSGGAVGATGATGTIGSTSNCSSSASPAVCAGAAAGSIAFPTGVTSVALTVNTTAVTANSQIFVFSDDSLGTRLGITCNSTLATLVGGIAITARTAGTSFQATYNGTIATNALCASYLIVN